MADLMTTEERKAFTATDPEPELCGAQYGSNPDLCTKPAGHEKERPRTADTAVHHNKNGTVWV